MQDLVSGSAKFVALGLQLWLGWRGAQVCTGQADGAGAMSSLCSLRSLLLNCSSRDEEIRSWRPTRAKGIV